MWRPTGTIRRRSTTISGSDRTFPCSLSLRGASYRQACLLSMKAQVPEGTESGAGPAQSLASAADRGASRAPVAKVPARILVRETAHSALFGSAGLLLPHGACEMSGTEKSKRTARFFSREHAVRFSFPVSFAWIFLPGVLARPGELSPCPGERTFPRPRRRRYPCPVP